MKVSLSVVKKLIDFELPEINELVSRVNSQLGGVEEVIDLHAKYKDAKIVRVVECSKHPNADKLSVCKIDVSQGELVQVVCGAPNARADMWAIWLPPKSIVPSTFGTDDEFKLDARELRGVMSYGMLAAGDELGLNDDHTGIIEVTETDLPEGAKLEAGASFGQVFGLDDYVIDIENKMFTHRPDLFGQLGVAREIAGIFHNKFESPEWYRLDQDFSGGDGLEIEASNDVPEKSARAMFVAIKNVEVGPSPLWLQCELVAMGAKPINNIVDATNYSMLMTAQPVHAYDYDKLRGQKIGVRMAKKGEQVRLLNDKVYELDEDDIVIADGEGAVGLAGIMGGFDSEVTEDTKNIVLEVANFDMYTLRRSSMRHGLFTDALTRFNKGQSPLQTAPVLKYLIDMIGGEQASRVFDVGKDIGYQRQVETSSEFINVRLGLDLPVSDMKRLIENTEIEVEADNQNLKLKSPFWRTDLELPEDIVEEVGRLYGFDKLPRELPSRSTSPVDKNSLREAKQKIRSSLDSAGANEVLTYSFVNEKVIKNANQDADQAFRLGNALSPDLQYYRLSVLPSLLDKVHMNIKAGHDEFILFEIGKGHNKKYHIDDDRGLPRELQFVDGVYASKKPRPGAAYFRIKKLVEKLAKDHGFSLKFKPVTDDLDYPAVAPFDLKRSAMVETVEGEFIGMIGELKLSVIKSFKLPNYSAAMTLDLLGLQKAIDKPSQTYVPLSRYPSISQDISLKTTSDISYSQVYEVVESLVQNQTGKTDISIEPISIYQSEGDRLQKTITLRLKFTSHEKTLKDRDASQFMERVASEIDKKFGAKRI